MKKILFFETPDFTGATRVTRTVAKALQNCYEVAFTIVDPKFNKNRITQIKESIVQHNPQILFASFVSINPEVIDVGRSLGLTLVIRQDYNLSDIDCERKKRIKETYPLADYLIAQTDEMGEALKKINGVVSERVYVLENPLDKGEITQKASEPNPFEDNGCFHFLWVGRLVPIKDIPTLQRAFEIVHEKFPDTDLTLVSNDDNPYRWIKNADCVVISSKSEASPNVLKEAQFLGTQVVSTDCSPSVRRLLSKRRVARVGDYKDLAKKMISVIYDDRLQMND